MKSIVKNITTLLFVVIAFASAELVQANSAEERSSQSSDQVEAALLYGLESEVRGVLESTFFNVITYKASNPSFSSENIEEELARIAKEAEAHQVRYIATLTLNFLVDSERFGTQEELNQLVEFSNEHDAFKFLDERIKTESLTSTD